MGRGFYFTCKKCGHKEEFCLGVGRRFPASCEELFGKAKKGELGEELQRVTTEENLPEPCTISAEHMLYKCPECEDVVCEPRCDVAQFVDAFSIDEDNIVYRHKHICNKCNKEMKHFNPENIEDVKGKCPCCGGEMMVDLASLFMWD